MKRILLLLLIAFSSSAALACSCGIDDRTLEERIDAADRVIRVRVVAAELQGEVAPGSDWFEKSRSERIAYRLRNVETLKGSGSEPPRMLGQAGDGGGDCTVRLPIGAEIILFVNRGERDIFFNYCSEPYLGVESVPEIDLRLKAIRDFVRNRTVIHRCENLPQHPFEPKVECEKRRDQAVKEWRAQERATD